jgi:hypothetical protein
VYVFDRGYPKHRSRDVAEYPMMLAAVLVIVLGLVPVIGANASTVFSHVASTLRLDGANSLHKDLARMTPLKFPAQSKIQVGDQGRSRDSVGIENKELLSIFCHGLGRPALIRLISSSFELFEFLKPIRWRFNDRLARYRFKTLVEAG